MFSTGYCKLKLFLHSRELFAVKSISSQTQILKGEEVTVA